MVNIMERVESVFKGATVSLGAMRSYTAVSHDDVAALLHNEFVKEKIWVKTSTKESSTEIVEKRKQDKQGEYIAYEYVSRVRVLVTYINAEEPSDREECEMTAYAIDSGDKGIGKAVSMAVKYAHLKNFTLESTDEEEKRDGHDYSHAPKEPYKHSGGQEFPASEKQLKLIQDLCQRKNYEPQRPLKGITSKQAGDLITKLMAMADVK
jgi:hypothetical protein